MLNILCTFWLYIVNIYKMHDKHSIKVSGTLWTEFDTVAYQVR